MARQNVLPRDFGIRIPKFCKRFTLKASTDFPHDFIYLHTITRPTNISHHSICVKFSVILKPIEYFKIKKSY